MSSDYRRLKGDLTYDGKPCAMIIEGQQDKIEKIITKANCYEKLAKERNRALEILEEVKDSDRLDSEMKGRIKEFIHDKKLLKEEV